MPVITRLNGIVIKMYLHASNFWETQEFEVLPPVE